MSGPTSADETTRAQFFSFAQLLDARDQAIGRAEVAERELEAANAEIAELRAGMPRVTGLRDDHAFGFHDAVRHRQCSACAERES